MGPVATALQPRAKLRDGLCRASVESHKRQPHMKKKEGFLVSSFCFVGLPNPIELD